MNTTSLRANPALPRASRIHSSMGRPMTGTRAFGTSSVFEPSRLPRPAPMMMGRMRSSSIDSRGMADELTIGIITDLHFGPEVRHQGKLRKLTREAAGLARAFVRQMNDEVEPDLVVN